MIDKYNYITYEYLNINPEEFYSGKFVGGVNSANFLEYRNNRYDIEYSRIRFIADYVKGGRVLDLGCGSGPYGRTLKKHCNVAELIGVDMDDKCISMAKKSYDDAIKFELGKKLPFEDNYFDYVISIDFFGHVEFRQKNNLVSEIYRVTKPKGLSVHIIESAEFKYEDVNISDPEDALLKYIKMEGHVGLEPAECVNKRWSKLFEVITIENAFLYPFYPIAAYLSDSNVNGELKEILSSFNDNEKVAAQIVLGYVCDYFKNLARNTKPDILFPKLIEEINSKTNLSEKVLSRIFETHSGLIYCVFKK